MAQEFQECHACALLDINGTLLDVTQLMLEIVCLRLGSKVLLVLLTVFLPLLLQGSKDLIQPCGGGSTAK